ncbi:hypothetical protein ACVWW6_006012 [Bradyrhizobium sp. USDA 3311]
MTVHRIPRATMAERLTALELRADGHDKRADAHEKLVQPMATQLKELYDAWTTAVKIFRAANQLWVKLGALGAGLLGAAAAVLTIVEKVRILFGH